MRLWSIFQAKQQVHMYKAIRHRIKGESGSTHRLRCLADFALCIATSLMDLYAESVRL